MKAFETRRSSRPLTRSSPDRDPRSQRLRVPLLPLPSEAPTDLEALPQEAEPADDLEDMADNMVPDRRDDAMAALDAVIAEALPQPDRAN